ncbi:MAG TPA: helix-turn-helix domain-containing protein [Solirubrobacteraceae bacterium]|nr:helix-turn-helix domain-containing protein [Solirubrobacteraceae bacterium]
MLSTRAPGQDHMRRRTGSLRPRRHARGIHDPGAPFAPLIDAKAAGRLLGVPHTWLLAQARAGRIPHHRLGHYVRFNSDDLARWLQETRRGPLRDSESRVSR